MNPKRKQKLFFIICIIMAVSLAAGLSLYALKQNINLFYTPSQVFAGQAPLNHDFRIGGVVKKGSVKHFQKSLAVEFLISDLQHSIKIKYQGILPDLFREGQGIVAQGKLTANGDFLAHQVLAKHDEKYTPPEIQQITLKTNTSI